MSRLLTAAGLLAASVAWSGSPVNPAGWTFQLIDGSTLTSAWNAGPPDTLLPLRGSFQLVQTNQNPLYTDYAVQAIDWRAGAGTNTTYHLTGQGSFQIGGELAVLQSMTLHLQLDDGQTIQTFTLTNEVATVDRRWPELDISLVESNQAALVHFYDVQLTAAPFRELWFSTATGFTAQAGSSPTNQITDGDLLAFSGRVVEPNAELLAPLGFMPVTGPRALQALTIAPGGEIQFALAADAYSELLGWLHPGDLLSNRGRVVQTNAQLLAAFQPPAGAPDAGLDAAQVLDDGEILFSIATNVYSPPLQATLGAGDILSNSGRGYRTQAQLLSAFHPAATNSDFGLAAFYVWPSGEIWFSTATGFQDNQLGPIASGDLLSDQGFIVYRNLELIAAFAPPDGVTNVGLHSLWLVTDTAAPAPSPQLLGLTPAPGGDLQLTWTAKARVFQVERSDDLATPFAPASPITPDLAWTDVGGGLANPPVFYRLRAW